MQPEGILNSPVANTVAKKLWPTMLFIVVMSIIACTGMIIVKDSLSQTSFTVAFFLWFGAMIIVTAFALYIFVLDARVQLYGSNNSGTNDTP